MALAVAGAGSGRTAAGREAAWGPTAVAVLWVLLLLVLAGLVPTSLLVVVV